MNSPNQTVLSGDKPSLLNLQKILKESKMNSIFLPLSTAFHNRVLSPAKPKFIEAMEESFPHNLPHHVEVLSNFDCNPFQDR